MESYYRDFNHSAQITCHSYRLGYRNYLVEGIPQAKQARKVDAGRVDRYGPWSLKVRSSPPKAPMRQSS
jgi:hypothetical protein